MSLFTAAVKQFGWRPSLGHRVEPAARLGGRGRAAAFCCILRHVIPSQRRITHTSKTPHRDQQQGPSSRGSVKLPGWQLGRRGRGRFYLPGKKPQPVVVAIASRGLFLPHPAPSCLTRAHPQVHFYNFCQHKLIKKTTRKCRNCKIFFFFFLKKLESSPWLPTELYFRLRVCASVRPAVHSAATLSPQLHVQTWPLPGQATCLDGCMGLTHFFAFIHEAGVKMRFVDFCTCSANFCTVLVPHTFRFAAALETRCFYDNRSSNKTKPLLL